MSKHRFISIYFFCRALAFGVSPLDISSYTLFLSRLDRKVAKHSFIYKFCLQIVNYGYLNKFPALVGMIEEPCHA